MNPGTFVLSLKQHLSKSKKLLVFFLLMTVNLILSAWSSSSVSSDITNYYFYQNKPYYLSVRADKIFVITKDQLTEDQFKTTIGQYYQVSKGTRFDIGQKMQFVDLNMQYDQASINTLLQAIKQNPSFAYTSAVYSPKDNDKVIEGLIDEILVQFKPSLTQNQIDNYLQSNHFSIVQNINISGGKSYVLKVPQDLNMYSIDAANMVYNSNLVNFAEPNFYYNGLLNFTPNDQFYPMQWSIRNTGTNIPVTGNGTPGCDMRVDSAWNITLGRPQCKVSMVDSGIDTTHEDLMANLTGLGYDFINGHAGYYDDFNHGTCTAGIVAAVGNNTIGVSGIAPNCKLVGVKIFNSAGSTTTTALTNGLMYSWQIGGWISSNSWGGGSPVSAADQTILDGVNQGRSGKGTIFCVASGNGNTNLQWPATNPNVIAVGGISPCNQRKSPSSCDNESWWGANYGTGLNVVAPCVKVYATDRMGSLGYDPTNYFATFNGTSSATPNCAGVCALMLSLDSTQRWDTVRVRLCRYADKVGSYSYTSAGPFSVLGNTWNNEMGYGKVNAYRLLSSIQNPPPIPQHDIYTGPFLSLPSLFLINTAYNIKTRVQNIGAANETNVPIKFFINGTLINTTNKNLTSGQVDSVSNMWTPTVAGTYNLMYASALANDTNRNNDTVRTTVVVYSSQPPLCEGFSGATFPPANWNLAGTNYWSRSTVSGYCVGQGSALQDFYDAPSGNQNQLITLTITATGTNDSLIFQDAYATYTTENDELQILTSTNGGSAWTPLITLTGGVSGTLVTAPPTQNVFVPSCSQWKYQRISLPAATNKIQFNAISAFGNNLYIDSVCVKSPVGIHPVTNEIPTIYSLSQNYPNPFNPTTKIQFALPRAGLVKLVVFDILGAEVITLVNEYTQPGIHIVEFNGNNLASGVYFYKIEASDFKDVKKMLLIK